MTSYTNLKPETNIRNREDMYWFLRNQQTEKPTEMTDWLLDAEHQDGFVTILLWNNILDDLDTLVAA